MDDGRPAHAVSWVGDAWECRCGRRWTAAEYVAVPDPERAIDVLAKHHYFENAVSAGSTVTDASLGRPT